MRTYTTPKRRYKIGRARKLGRVLAWKVDPMPADDLGAAGQT
jgi:hypothetical protein